MKSNSYERLCLLNRCLEQVAEIIDEFRREKLIHPEYAKSRKRATEDLRADLSCVLTGLLCERERELGFALARTENKQKRADTGKKPG
jgi:hypothetical protein